MDFSNIEQDALQNFDDLAANYDDMSSANMDGGVRVIKRASFDLRMTNSAAVPLTFELFNSNNSFTKDLNPALVTDATVTYIPQNSFEGEQAAGVGIVGFNQRGNLLATGAVAYTPVLTVVCPQYTYRGLLEASGFQPFRIYGIRMTTTTDAQIDNDIVHFNSTFLGSKAQNSLSPRTYFKPEQFQSKIVDIACDFRIDRERGLIYTLNAGETVTFNVMIERLEFQRSGNRS